MKASFLRSVGFLLVGVLAVPVGFAFILLPSQQAGAASLSVTNCANSGSGSLRQTVANAAVGDTITFALSCPVIDDPTGTILVTKNVIISGPGATSLAISGDNGNGIFSIASGVTASISGLTLKNTAATNGGAINSSGTLTVADSAFTGNNVTGSGGAIYANGNLTITNSSLSNNSAAYGGAIFCNGTLTASGLTVSANSASGQGGGVYASGPATVTTSTLSSNTTQGQGGAINASSTLSISGSTVSNNSASSAGVVSGGGIYSSGTLTLVGSSVSGNTIATTGNYQSADGGGIYSSGPMVVAQSSVSGNSATSTVTANGSCYYCSVATAFAYGGGVYATSTTQMSASTISGNAASGSASNTDNYYCNYYGSGHCPATYVDGGGFYNSGTLTVANSTFSGNTNTASGSNGTWSGGAIFNTGTSTFTNSTVANNTAPQGAGIGTSSGTVGLQATLLAGNTTSDCSGAVTDNGYNIDDDGSCGFTTPSISDYTTLSRTLGPLANHSGPTQTIALLPANPAIQIVAAEDCPATDQRGASRTTPCDVGAYDTAGPGSQTIAFTSTTPANASVGGPSYTPTATGGASGNPVTFTIDAASTSVCSIATNVVSFTALGTCTIDADQAGTSAYSAAPQVQQPMTVGQGAQAITFTSTPPVNAAVGGPGYTVSATGGASGNAVTFSIDASSTSVCSIAGVIVSFARSGTCTVDATQIGSSAYLVGAAAQSFPITASISVTNCANSGSGSLRQTVANAAVGDSITFAVSCPVIDDPTGTILITKNLTISGPGATSLALSGDSGNGIFSVASGVTASISGLTMKNTSAGNGGAINSSGTLIVADSTFTENNVTGSGGAIYANGNLTITNSSLSSNSAAYGGAIFCNGALTASGLTVSSNSASSQGGGVFASGPTTISTSTLSSNTTQGQGGAINASNAISISDSTVSNNSATSASTVAGGGIYSSGTLTLTGSTLSGNTANANWNYQAADGGGIYSSGPMVITQSSVSGNSATSTASCSSYYYCTVQVFAYGGGIYATSTTQVSASTVSRNTVSGNVSGSCCMYTYVDGGGFYNSGTLTVANSTFSGNTNTASGSNGTWSGGAIFNTGTSTFTNSTVANNTAPQGAGIGTSSGTVGLQATLLAGNTSSDCSGAVTDNGYNIDDDGSCGFTTPSISDYTTLSRTLGPLANNSGPTQTIALLPASPAIQIVTAVDCPATDQRGASRTTPCDVGAYDTAGPGPQTIAFTSTAPANASVGGPSYTPTATGGASGNPVTFTVDAASTSVCSIATNVVSFTALGTCTIDADQAGTPAYSAAPQVQQSMTVGQGAQAITFTSTPPVNAAVGGPGYTVSATGGASGNAVTFSIDAASVGCTLSAGIVRFVGIGSCVINANQLGNANLGAAPKAQQTIVVALINLAITTPSLSAGVIGTAYSVTLTAGAGNSPYTWKLVTGSGKLPAGLKLNSATGVISGTPSKKSITSTFTVQVLDTKTKTKPHTQNTATATFTITIS